MPITVGSAHPLVVKIDIKTLFYCFFLEISAIILGTGQIGVGGVGGGAAGARRKGA